MLSVGDKPWFYLLDLQWALTQISERHVGGAYSWGGGTLRGLKFRGKKKKSDFPCDSDNYYKDDAVQATCPDS